MDRNADSDEYTGQEEQQSGTRPNPHLLRTTGSETRHERSWRVDGASRGVVGGQSNRNNLTWTRSSNHSAAPAAGSWRNINREASGGARPKDSNTFWRRNNLEREDDSKTQIDRQETPNWRRRAESQGEGTTEQPRDTSTISSDFFRRPGKPRSNWGSTTSSPTSPPTPVEETKWRRGQSDVCSGSGRYTGQVQVKQTPKTPSMSEEELKTLLTASPQEVLSKLLSRKHEWLALLNLDSFNDNVMTLILGVLSCICDLNVDPKVKQDIHMVFSMIESEGFLSKHLTRYLVGLSTQQPHDDQERDSETLANNIKMILKLLQVFLEHKPEIYGEMGVVLILLEKAVSLAVVESCTDINHEGHSYMIQVEQLKECYHALDESHQIIQHVKARQPPNNFREIPIIPDSLEIQKPTKPFLRKNILKGRYQDVEHYLDVQFRLLREDFVAPLREGIAEFLSKVNNHHQDIRVYRKVSVQGQKIGKRGQFTLEFDVKGLNRINWQTSKRLIYGSFVCLTQDNFKSILCASVADRNTKDLEKGLVDVCFLTESSRTPTGTFVMVESAAYFEAYRHVLLGLQRMNSDNFPFERYIVNVSCNVRTPKYLSEDCSDVYDLRPLVVATDQVFEDEGLTETFVNAACVSILDPQSWPTAEALHLDESQKAAVQAALTKEFAIIQGPPGTGKTYIGLKIIEILLYNTPTTPDASPILVVCYTNHALDQFLEGILNFGEENLVRVGSRSKSEVLESRNLSYLKRHLGRPPKNMQQREVLEETEASLHETKSAIHCTLLKVAFAKTIIIQVEKLNNVMSNIHQQSFQKNKKRPEDPTTNLLNWLNVVDIDHESDSSDMSDSNEEKDEFIDVEDESARIQHERRIDDEDDSRVSEEQRKQNELSVLRQNAAYSTECKKRCGSNLESTPKEELKKDDMMSDREAPRVTNVWSLTLSDRWRLYRLWVKKYIEEQEEMLTDYRISYDSLSKEIQAMKNNVDFEVLSKARVIGMTTTGAARCQSVLQLLGPRIVIVEEAAEVLEAHIITALAAKCQHLILIGDHQQLKPNPTVYRLAKVFNMDTSLFERMINNGVPCQTLNHQHRMRPEISKLMKKHFYKNLHDDESVMDFDDIKGVAHNMFFIDHNQFEDEGDDNKTKSNQHEAEVLVELCRYLLHQGYQPKQITILTTYLGQLFTFKKLMDKGTFEGVRVSVVDNFQGEENDIILLSLVRSNEEGSIGFLKTSNRVCVALSRARMGFYCIGNANILRKSSIWSSILRTLEDEKKISSSLALVCQNHLVVTAVATARDFKEKVQDGGCGEPCGYMLPCNHMCKLHCHPFDQKHRVYKCQEPCSKLCRREEHTCLLKCYEECTPCSTNVHKLMPKCGHVIQVKCEMFDSVTCTEPCPRSLPCGHPCRKACGDSCPTCIVEVSKSMPECGHVIQVECRRYGSITCTEPCPRTLSCGHACKGACGAKCTTYCTVKVSKHVTKCGHDVLMECAKNPDLTPCTHLCDKLLVCGHRCPKKCSKPCPEERLDDAKMMNLRIHFNFESFCKEKCERSLPCGHPCPNKCCEPCPKETVDPTYGEYVKLHEKVRGHIVAGKLFMVCTQITNKKLPGCDHTVLVPCHADITSLTCKETCNKELSCGHRCKDKCGVPCKCKLRVNRKLPSCEHSARLPCYQDVNSYQCEKKCQKMLQCGHPCSNKCCEPCPTDGEDAQTESTRNLPAKACQRSVRKKFRGCHHSVVLPCYKDVESVVCAERCTKVLSCSHKCPNRCGDPCPSSNPKKTDTYCDWNDDGNSSSEQDDLYVRKCQHFVNKKIPSCGHVIESPCYKSVESLVCPKPCEKILPCGHQCENKCGEPCPNEECTSSDDEEEMNENEFVKQKCQVTVSKQLPDCWHFMNLPCYKKAESVDCSNPCEKILKCGHKCPNECGETCLESEQCDALVERNLSGCGHKVETNCCRNVKLITCREKCEKVLPCGHVIKLACWKTSYSAAITSCQELCSHLLHCGHNCPGTCGSCAGPGGAHKVCNNKCGTRLLCGHRCSEMCCDHELCSPHKLCNNSSKRFPPKSTKSFRCKHRSKARTTSCNLPCIQKLRCNHFCLGVCGEPCPPVCRICHKKDVAGKYPPGPIRPKETFIYLEDCGHLCETRFLDEMFAGFQPSGTSFVQIQPALCPKCHTPIRTCPRYEDALRTIKESVDIAREKCNQDRFVKLSFAVGGWMRCPEGHVFCQDKASDDLLCPDCSSY
ncbi:NFX1-type zinc finger-containing protein 1-like [Asterias rubens]|uniref:NFX1-type zinc finger-containing protein 1-like n=1 Tax=Asterias rubens TaxID=7604 RepID=UPI0014552FEE|nr:NFX1-type zinc finger-containing protein 1-like [Asterias rubens]